MTPTPSPDTVEPTEPTEAELHLMADIAANTTWDGLPEGVYDYVLARVRQHVAAEVARKTALLQNAAGFCVKHKPTGGHRNCLLCGMERLYGALHRIAALCEEPNEMGVTSFDIDYNEDALVERVAAKLTAHKSSPPPQAS